MGDFLFDPMLAVSFFCTLEGSFLVRQIIQAVLFFSPDFFFPPHRWRELFGEIPDLSSFTTVPPPHVILAGIFNDLFFMHPQYEEFPHTLDQY